MIIMDCQYGLSTLQKKNKKNQPNQSDRIYLQGTRKQGCLAHVEVREFILYPEYSIDTLLSTDLTMKQVRTLKEEKLKSLKLCLQKKSQVEIVENIFYTYLLKRPITVVIVPEVKWLSPSKFIQN